MEEFFLRRFLFSQKLDIVNEQDIDVAVFIAKGFCCIVLDGIDQFIGESLGTDIEDLCAWVIF